VNAPNRTVAAVALLCASLAASGRFVLDDAYISLRYARNLAEGNGLVFNPGEYVEGFTNLAWTVLAAVPHVLGLSAVDWVVWLGLASFFVTLVVVGCGARDVRDARGALFVAVAVGTNYTLVRFASGGLETSFVVVLVTTVAMLCLDDRWTIGRCHLAAGLLVAASLTRLDASLAVVMPLCALLLSSAVGRIRMAVHLLAPWGAALVLVQVWRLRYYGAWLPNTFQAKVGASIPPERGLAYLGAFVAAYHLVPLVVAATVGFVRTGDGPPRRPLVPLLAFMALHALYLVAVGGDYMEFRFLATSIPCLYVVLFVGCGRLFGPRLGAVVGLVAALGGSWSHGSSQFRVPVAEGIESVPMLAAAAGRDDGPWVAIGRFLRSTFPEGDVSIATTAAGAIPYWSRLPTTDMFGLCDAWIARHGTFVHEKTGHQRRVTLGYLLERKVNLVLGHPSFVDPSAVPSTVTTVKIAVFGAAVTDEHTERRRMSVLYVPVQGGLLRVLYLTPHPAVDAKVRALGWQCVPVTEVGAGA